MKQKIANKKPQKIKTNASTLSSNFVITAAQTKKQMFFTP